MPDSRSPSSPTLPEKVRLSSVAAAANRWRKPNRAAWTGFATIFAVTLVAYLPSLRDGFVWNDVDYVTRADLRPLGGLWKIWFQLGATQQYYPLLHSLFWVEYQLWGGAAGGYHLANVLLHAAAACLLAALVRRLLDYGERPGRYAGAEWLAAALFALHPVHAASVAWITEQKNTLSTVLYLGAALLYLRFDETRRSRPLLLGLTLFCLSLLAKTATATLPEALLVILWWKRGRLSWRRDVRPLLPWVVLGVAAALGTTWVEDHNLGGRGIGAKGPDFALSFPGRVLVAGRAIWFYLGSLTWPARLNFIYRRWTIDVASGWQWLFPVAAVAVAAVCWRVRRRWRTPLAMYLLFVGTLFPVLGFENLYGSLYSRVWDHWQYLADPVPLAVAGVALVGAGTWAGVRFRTVGPAVGIAICVLFGTMDWRRCADFRDEETLFRATLALNPECWLAQQDLGILCFNENRLPEAIVHDEAAVAIAPGRRELHLQLADDLAMAGRFAEAEEQYRATLRISPDYAEAHNGLGNLLTRMDGRLPEAVAELEEALRLAPAVPDVHNNLGIALLMSGRTPEAIAQFEQALRLNPSQPLVHLNLAAALQTLGRTAEAAAQTAAARRLGFPVAHPFEVTEPPAE